MSFLFDFCNFILIGVILSLTVRWCLLLWKIHKVKALQKEPFDRMISISSQEVLLGLLRKRSKKTDIRIDIMDIMLPHQVEIDEDVFISMYNAFDEKGLKISIIPNEDIYKANKRGLITDPSKYYLNDEIKIRLSNSENAAIIRHKEQLEIKKKLKQEKLEREKERQLKLQKQKEIEDQINI